MQEAVRVLDERMDKDTGQVSVFLSLKPKSWLAVLEVYPLDQAAAKLREREEQGFLAVSKVEEEKPLTVQTSFSRRPPPPREIRPRQMAGFELYDGLAWTVEVTNDLEVASDSDLLRNNQLQCYKFLKESYRRFELQPSTTDERELRGTLVLTPVDVTDPVLKEKLTLTFHLDIPERTVKDYFYVPEPEPVPEPKAKPKFDLPALPENEPKPAPKPPVEKQRTFSLSALERLTQSTRRPNVRECRYELNLPSPLSLSLARFLSLLVATIRLPSCRLCLSYLLIATKADTYCPFSVDGEECGEVRLAVERPTVVPTLGQNTGPTSL